MHAGKSCDHIRPAGLHSCRSCPAGLRLKRAPETESQLTQAIFWEVRTPQLSRGTEAQTSPRRRVSIDSSRFLGGQNLFNSSLIANYFRG